MFICFVCRVVVSCVFVVCIRFGFFAQGFSLSLSVSLTQGIAPAYPKFCGGDVVLWWWSGWWSMLRCWGDVGIVGWRTGCWEFSQIHKYIAHILTIIHYIPRGILQIIFYHNNVKTKLRLTRAKTREAPAARWLIIVSIVQCVCTPQDTHRIHWYACLLSCPLHPCKNFPPTREDYWI